MTEFSSSRSNKSSERLQLLDFSFITPADPDHVREAKATRISELTNTPVFDLRVIGSAYYALELCNPMLKSYADAMDRLQKMEPGTDEAMTLIDNVMIADAVWTEITRSYNLYRGLSRDLVPLGLNSHDLIVNRTAQFTSKNTGWLMAIGRMRDAKNPQKRIGRHTGRVSEAVARLTIARYTGIQIKNPEEAS